MFAGKALVFFVIGMAFLNRSGAAAEVANPTVSAPVTGGSHGQPFGGFAAADLPAGFVEEERFISGTATSFTKSGDWGLDGHWALSPGATSPYKVRILLPRPSYPPRFHPRVIV